MLKPLGSALAGLALALTLATSASAAYPNPGRVTGDTVGVHDPTMIKASNGSYILISTGNWLEIRTSTDRINFRRVGSVWAAGQPTWTFQRQRLQRHRP